MDHKEFAAKLAQDIVSGNWDDTEKAILLIEKLSSLAECSIRERGARVWKHIMLSTRERELDTAISNIKQVKEFSNM